MRVWNKIGVGLKLSSTVLKKVQEFENFVRAENFRILNYDYLIWESYGHTFDFLLKLFFLGYSTEKSKTVFFKLESPSRFLYINLKCHKLYFSNLYIFATQCRRPLIFQTMNSVKPKNLSLKYQRFASSDCKDIGIRQFEFVTKPQFLYRLLIRDSDWLNFIHFPGYKYKIRSVSILRKRED